MTHFRKLLTLAALFLSLALPQTASALSIYDIIMLSSNDHEPDAIIRLIGDTGSAFQLEAMDAVRLKDAGVADDVVAAMFRAKPAAAPGEAEVPEQELPAPASLADLLLLTEGGIAREVILAFIESRGIGFVPDAQAVTRLRSAGLDDYIINRMLTMTPQVPGPAQAQVPRQQTYEPPPQAYPPPQQAYQPLATQPATPLRQSYVLPEVSYAYPIYYYGPSWFVGFSGIQHSMFRHRYAHVHPYPGYWFFAHGKHKYRHGGKDWHKGDHWKHGGRDHDWKKWRDDDERQVRRIDGGKIYDGNDSNDDQGGTWSVISQPSKGISGGSPRTADSTVSPSRIGKDRAGSSFERYSRTPANPGWGSGRSSSSLRGNSVTGYTSESRSGSLGSSSSVSRSPANSSNSASAGSAGSSRSGSSGSSLGSSRSSSAPESAGSSRSSGSSFERHMNTPASSSLGWGSGRSSNARSAGGISRPR